jgi:hypothetical protein
LGWAVGCVCLSAPGFLQYQPGALGQTRPTSLLLKAHPLLKISPSHNLASLHQPDRFTKWKI